MWKREEGEGRDDLEIWRRRARRDNHVQGTKML
jgi:hypothetical protein